MRAGFFRMSSFFLSHILWDATVVVVVFKSGRQRRSFCLVILYTAQCTSVCVRVCVCVDKQVSHICIHIRIQMRKTEIELAKPHRKKSIENVWQWERVRGRERETAVVIIIIIYVHTYIHTYMHIHQPVSLPLFTFLLSSTELSSWISLCTFIRFISFYTLLCFSSTTHKIMIMIIIIINMIVCK